MTLTLVPMNRVTATAFIRAHHRHHGPTVGYKFAVGVADEDERLVGVAVVGLPIARLMDDGYTLEVTRTCTDGHKNANSMLYGAAWRAARALGYRRLITYTQEGESGASLRAAGYTIVNQRAARSGWDTPARPRDQLGTEYVQRYRWQAS